jgi:hypothetical protein
VHDSDSGRMARRNGKLKSEPKEEELVDYADDEPSALASMFGGLIEANVESRIEKRKDFSTLVARVGIWVNDIDEGVTLDFKGRGGWLTIHNGLVPKRTLTIRTDAETVMSLSNLKIGLFGLPIYYDEVGRGVAAKLLSGKLKIDGMLANVMALNAVTRIFSVQ